jgi:beta-lactamase class A
LLFILLLAAALSAFAQTPLVSELAKIAADAGGAVGVSGLHVESGRRAGLRGEEAYPMASAYKFPIALALLNQVGSGTVDLATTVTLSASDIRPFHSPIAERSPKGGLKITVGELLDQTLLESDNTASDYILGLAGGPAAVTGHFRQFKIAGIRVDRSEGEIALDYAGVTDRLSPDKWTLEWFNRALAAVPKDQQRAAAQKFLKDPRDTASPDAMVTLLMRVMNGEVLSKDSTALLLDRMTRMAPGAARIKGLLPAGTLVAHRTGTGGTNEGVNSATNDAGIITLPNGKGHIVLAVFIKGSPKDLATREHVIASIAKAVFDAWSK